MRHSEILLFAAAMIGVSLPCTVSAEDAASPQAIEFFEKRVRPLLVQHCQECHGAKKQEASLRLDSREALVKGGDNGAVVVPGAPEKSRLIAAIGYADEDLQMPPDGQLPPDAVATLTEWVRLGAAWPVEQRGSNDLTAAEKWKTHWASQPSRAQTPPAVRQKDWPTSPIDNFVLAKLEAKGLTPSPAADRRTLLRRVTFDLIGLPPTEAELTEFEADTSPDAFAKVVERLLASPAYGERWGRHWLDVARYADTKEYVRLKEEQRYLYAFTYRDYVIRSFNEDLPYDQFIVEQLAADLLPLEHDRRAQAALGFLTLGRQFTGNPQDIIDDRIDVVTRGLLGLTVTCARCHDHKYDPLPTADYYSLYGVFASTDAPLVPPLLEESPSNAAQQSHLAGTRVREAAYRRGLQQVHDSLLDELRNNVGEYLAATAHGRRAYLVPLPSTRGEVRQFVVEKWLDFLDADARQSSPAFAPWHLLGKITADEDFAHRSQEILSTASGVNGLVRKALSEQPLTSMADVAQAYGRLFRELYARDKQRKHKLDKNLLTNGSFEDEPPVSNTSPHGWTLVGSRFCTLSSEGTSDGQLAAVFADGTPQSQPPTAHDAALSQKVVTKPGTRYRLAFEFAAFGSSAETHAQTLRCSVFGAKSLAERTCSGVGSNPAVFSTVTLEFTADGEAATITIADATNNGENGFADAVVDDVRLVELTASGMPVQRTNEKFATSPDEAELLEILIGSRSPTSLTYNEAIDFYLYDNKDHDKVVELRRQLNELLSQTGTAPPRAHTLVDREVPYDPCVLVRGDPTRHGPVVPRQFLSAVVGDSRRPFEQGSGRLELARAIVDRDNPLTARVLVNRVWMNHFGFGLVRSPSNFGLRGETPSHPELLDYLAERFMSEGWSLKKLHRWIVLSSTYRQSGTDRPEGIAIDADNRLLWKMNRRRLDFEGLRDSMLQVAGRLDRSLGGPPIDLAGANNFRRTVYGLVDRQNLNSMFGTFDFASPETHSPSRHATTVPQQALFFLNSPFVIEQARAFAERPELSSLVDAAERVKKMYQIGFVRAPSADEQRAAQEFIAAGGTWKELGQAFLASNEFNFVD